MYVYRCCGSSGFTRTLQWSPCKRVPCSLQDLQELPVEMEHFPAASSLGLERGAHGVEWNGKDSPEQTASKPFLHPFF